MLPLACERNGEVGERYDDVVQSTNLESNIHLPLPYLSEPRLRGNHSETRTYATEKLNVYTLQPPCPG